MKSGMRRPSWKKSLAARTTGKYKRRMKRAIDPLYGKRGMGFVHDPKRAVRGAIYRRTTFSLFDLMKPKREKALERKLRREALPSRRSRCTC